MDQFINHPLYKIHNLDSVINTSGRFYAKRFLVLFITSFLMSLAIGYLTLRLNFNELLSITDPTEMIEKLKSYILPLAGVSLVSLLFNTILQYYVLYNPLDRSVTIFTATYRSLKYFVPYLIIMILFAFMGSFALVMGLMVFIIGIFFAFVYIATLYFLVLPVLMVEGPYIGNAISRAFRLAHRNFWSNMGWVAVFLAMLLVISFILSGIILIPFSGSFLRIFSKPEVASNAIDFMTNPLYLLLSAVVSALYLPLMPIFSAALYFNGMAREETAGVDLPTDDEPGRIKVEDLYARPEQDDQKEE